MQFQHYQPTLERGSPEVEARLQALAAADGCTVDEMVRVYERSLKCDQHYMNETYLVTVITHADMGPWGMVQLSILRRDGKCPDWAEKQAIKNYFLGPECEAVEMFPAEGRLVDTSPNYHLWGLRAGIRFPFGIDRGRVVTDQPELEKFGVTAS